MKTKLKIIANKQLLSDKRTWTRHNVKRLILNMSVSCKMIGYSLFIPPIYFDEKWHLTVHTIKIILE